MAVADTHDSHDVHDDHHHDHGEFIAHHFDGPEQQFDSGKLGIWLFLVTEILFFGGLFVAYTLYRSNHPEIFEQAHVFLNKYLGGLNTIVLLFSSLTMALGVREHEEQLGDAATEPEHIQSRLAFTGNLHAVDPEAAAPQVVRGGSPQRQRRNLPEVQATVERRLEELPLEHAWMVMVLADSSYVCSNMADGQTLAVIAQVQDIILERCGPNGSSAVIMPQLLEIASEGTV